MNIFNIGCITESSTITLKTAKDSYESLSGETYNYLYNNKPKMIFKVVLAAKSFEEKKAVFNWLNKYQYTTWGFALPTLNDAKIANPGFGIDLQDNFYKTICEAPQYQIIDTDGNAKIVNNYLTFGTASFAIIRRFVSCILTSDISISSVQNYEGYCQFDFELTEIV